METIQETIKYLEKEGKVIGKKASKGDKLCIDIMKYYKMFYDCQEPGSMMLLIEHTNQYIKQNE